MTYRTSVTRKKAQMSTTTANEPITTEELAARMTDLADRAAAAETALARIAEREARELALLSDPAAASKPRSQFANVHGERQEHARLARVSAHQGAVEAERLRAIKDAPKQLKRDKALAAYDEQLRALDSEYEDRKCRIAADRSALSRSPL